MVTAVRKLACERWQESHRATPVVIGMWPVDLPPAVAPLWQVSQVPVPTALAAWCTKLADVQELTEVWQLSQVVTPAWTGVFGLPAPD